VKRPSSCNLLPPEMVGEDDQKQRHCLRERWPFAVPYRSYRLFVSGHAQKPKSAINHTAVSSTLRAYAQVALEVTDKVELNVGKQFGRRDNRTIEGELTRIDSAMLV
jgi:hypothetical protein